MLLSWIVIVSLQKIAKNAGVLKWVMILVVIAGCKPSGDTSLIIATSANMQFAMEGLCSMFYKESGILPHIVCGSSGKLAAQIRAGAPFDIFVSADMVYPAALYGDGLAENQPVEYARGQLVLWTMTNEAQVALDDLCKGNTRYIALANPQTAPYGKAAVQVLEGYGIWDIVEEKLVYAESISQVAQFILSGAADYGFVARSVVSSPEIAGKGSWIVLDSSMYAPIRQGVVLLKNKREHQVPSERFMKFLFSARASTLLRNYGYIIPDRREVAELI